MSNSFICFTYNVFVEKADEKMWQQAVNDYSKENETLAFQKHCIQNNKYRFLKNISLLAVIMFACTLLSVILKNIGNIESNIVMIYLLGVIIFSYLASGYVYNFLSSLSGVLLYNFFFTEPYYTLEVYKHDYLITFLIMFGVGFFTSALTMKIKWETFLAEERELRIKALYSISKKLLGVKNSDNLAEISAQEIAKQFSADVLIQFLDANNNFRNRYVAGNDLFVDDKERIACLEACQSGVPCGFGTSLFPKAQGYYLPIIGQSGVLGIIGIIFPNTLLFTSLQTEFLETIASQIAAVLEREKIYEQQAETQMQVQCERLRADMFRTISHDLRTPLTNIIGSANTVTDNYNTISDKLKLEFLHNIYEDACWLNEMVENILHITRFDEGRIKLNIEEEAAEEILAEAIGHVKKHSHNHQIGTNIPPNLILLEADGVLLTRVLVNLLENAINYTPEGSAISVSLRKNGENVLFEVSDNGPGIPEEVLPRIFERFYSHPARGYGGRRGTGLGLPLCKSIVEAHGGEIKVANIQPHGTSVQFWIPSKEEQKNAALNPDSRR
ncbi:MAG: ATP-binding protein [Acidaminococcaceae bacterium]